MALSATQIQAIIDRLVKVLTAKGGAGSVTFEGRTISYASVKEVSDAITMWEGRLARANGSRPTNATIDLRNF